MAKKFTIEDIWSQFGITKHWGGIPATRQLIKLYGVKPGQYLLEIGCGTGYTACLMAKEYQAKVIASDVNSRVLKETKKRVVKQGLGNKVKVMKADSRRLPFPPSSFDVVIAESVLAFCDAEKVASEVFRVLKPGGVFGDNEGTYLKPPPASLADLLSKAVGLDIQLLSEKDWRVVFEKAGFKNISSRVWPINYKDQFVSQLRIEGLGKYFSSILESIFDPAIRRAFFNKEILFNREMLKLMLQFRQYLGYGLYVARKPKPRSKRTK
jgi:SAM-dependent methyltransferase